MRACVRSVLLLVVWVTAAGAEMPGPPAEVTSPPPMPEVPSRFSVLPEQWKPELTPSPALAHPRVITRDDTIEGVTLQEAIQLALENNPGIAASRLEPTRVATDVLGAQAQFDPVLDGEVSWAHAKTPNANALAGTLSTDTDTRLYNTGLSKLFRSGTQLRIDFLNDRQTSNANFIQLSPEYSPELRFSLVQPLLRDFGWDFSYMVVRVAERTAEGAVYQYEADLADFVLAVIDAYWNVVGAREDVALRRESLALAQRTVDENQARVRVGLLAPVAVLEAQSQAAARETDLIVSENLLKTSQQRLAQLAFYRPDGTVLPRMLEPTENVKPEGVHVDEQIALATALDERPEIQASSRGVEARQYEERIASNRLLPRLDLVGGYGVLGLSGKNQPGQTFCSDGMGGLVACARPNSPFAGSASRAYDRLTSGDFDQYSVGIRVEVPIANAAARAEEARSRIALDQAELRHRDLISNITLEVRDTSADVESTMQAIETSRVARELAQENLRNQQKRHEVGMATTKDLLDFQNQLTQARFTEVQARIRYAIALARWRRAQGTLLAQHQIVLEAPKRSTPWFARF